MTGGHGLELGAHRLAVSRTLYGNALTGLVLGLLVFLPRGVEVLYALEKSPKAPAPPVQVRVPAWVKRIRNLRIWRIRFVPSYRQEITFDDNIFLNDRGEGKGREADLIITERPGVRVEFTYRKVNVSLDYRGEIRQYVNHPELNTRGFAGDVKLDLDIGLDQDLIRIQQQRGRWYFKITDDIKGRTDAVDLVDPKLVARLKNLLKVRTGLEFKRGELYVEYENSYLYVFDSEFKRIQHMQHSVRLGSKMEVTPRWTVELMITPGLIDFDQGVLSDQQFVEVLARARGTLSPRLSTTLAIGYRHQRVVSQGASGDRSDFNGLVFDASMRWDLTQRTRLFVSAIRELQLSSVSNYKEATIGRISVVHELVPRRMIATLRLEVNHQQASDGPQSNDPRNTRFLAVLKLDYKFRSWLVFDISYQYQQNLSNQEDGDFYQNRVTVGMNFKF